MGDPTLRVLISDEPFVSTDRDPLLRVNLDNLYGDILVM